MSIVDEAAAEGTLRIDEIPVPARIVDVETFRFLAVNRACCELFGYSEEEFRHLDLSDFFFPEDLADTRAKVRSTIATPKTFGRLRQRRRDGSLVVVELIAQRIQYRGRDAALAILIDRTDEARNEQAHAETERRMVAVVEGMRDAFVLLDSDFRIRYANRNCFPILLRPPMEVEGVSFWEAFPEIRDVWYASFFTKVMRDRVSLHFEVAEPFGQYALDVFPVEDGMGITFRDIREQKEQEARQRFLLDLSDRIRTLESPTEILWAVVNSVGDFFEVSRTTYGEIDETEEYAVVDRDYVRGVASIQGRYRLEDFGYAVVEQLRLGRTVVVEDVRTDVRTRESAAAFESVEIRSFMCVPLVKGGRFLSAFALHHASPRSWSAEDIALIEGIADRTWHAVEHARAQQEVRRLNQDLEARVEARTAELRLAKDDLEGFCYSVSHDLRAPLRAMMANAMILIEDHGGRLDESGRENLRRLGAAAKRMGDLIDDLLQFSRLGRKVIEPREVDLSEMAQDLADDLAERFPERRVEFVIQPGLAARADEQLLRLALQNLLDNASKFSSRSPNPRVEFGRVPEGFFVRDNGVGFDPAYAHKLFRPFERLHREEEYSGTGIGLANVKRIIERHGGKVHADSTLGNGATFWFTLG